MKTIRHLLYISVGIGYYYLVYVFFGVENIVSTFSNFYLTTALLSYASGIVAFFTIFGLVSILEGFIERGAKSIADKTETEFDNMVLDILFSSIHTVKYLLAFYFSWKFVIAPDFVNESIEKLSSIFLLVIVLLFVTKLINLAFTQKLIDESKMKSMSKSLMPFVRKAIIAFVWIIGIITIISNLGYDVTALIAGAGVGGIAVALAAQKSIANIFGAITILMNKPFTLGDYVTINGHTGTVKDIGLSYITLIDRNGHNVMIPNENIISTSIENETKRNFRRADFSIGLIYDTSLPKMQKGVQIIEDILQSYVDDKKLQKYRVNFEAFGDFSLNIFVTYFSDTKVYDKFVKEKEEINLEIKKQFGKAKLEMAFPTTEMIIKNGDIS